MNINFYIIKYKYKFLYNKLLFNKQIGFKRVHKGIYIIFVELYF